VGLIPSITSRLTSFAAHFAFQRIEATGIEQLGERSIDVIVADAPARWTGTVLTAAALPVASTGIVYDRSGQGNRISEVLQWITVSPEDDTELDVISSILPGLRMCLQRCSTLVLCGRTFPEPIFAAALALTLAEEYPDRVVRLIPAGVRRVVDPHERERVLVQLGASTQVNALRVGHKWQRRQRAAELTRLVEETQASMYISTDNWDALRAWDAVCRLHRRQQASGWNLGTSQRMYKLLVGEPDGQQLATRVQHWLNILDGAELRPSDLDRSVEHAPSSAIASTLEVLLLPLVLVGRPLYWSFQCVGRLSTPRMHDENEWTAWRTMFISNALMMVSLVLFSLVLGYVHGVLIGLICAAGLLASGWVTRRLASRGGWVNRVWGRLRTLRTRPQIHAWAWQERVSLLEAIQSVLGRPRGDDPALFPKTIFER